MDQTIGVFIFNFYFLECVFVPIGASICSVKSALTRTCAIAPVSVQLVARNLGRMTSLQCTSTKFLMKIPAAPSLAVIYVFHVFEMRDKLKLITK